MKSRVLGLILGVVLIGGMILTGVLFYNHYSKVSLETKSSQKLAERRKDVEESAKKTQERIRVLIRTRRQVSTFRVRNRVLMSE